MSYWPITSAKRERLTMMRMFELLRLEGYAGSYDAVGRYAQRWRREQGVVATAYVPLVFAPGKAYQFDWSHEIVVLGGVTTTAKVAPMRLCHSRMPFVLAYPRETQEVVFDAHNRALAFYCGACARGIYDNMKTAVDTVFVGEARRFNRRFEQLCSHYLVEPVACTPGAGWEKGQVENHRASGKAEAVHRDGSGGGCASIFVWPWRRIAAGRFDPAGGVATAIIGVGNTTLPPVTL